MLTIYHSNQLDLLKSLIAALIEQDPQDNVFDSEVILVQSPGMAQWLQMQLAEHFSIAANIEFSLPASFIWRMFTQVLPDIPQESAFSKDAMIWKLMWLLPNVLQQDEFAALKHYLADDTDKRKCHQLAVRIADLFDQYLVYRPDWIAKWENNQLVEGLDSAQLWQAPLWRALTAYTLQLNQPMWHRANLYQRFIQTVNDPNFHCQNLPKRIFICGIAALPPVYMQALEALSHRVDIHLMFTNPCRWYWGDIKDQKWLAKLAVRKRRHHKEQHATSLFKQPEKAAELFNQLGELEKSNPLLASWGKLGRDNFYLLQDLEHIQQVDAFVDLATDNLLQTIQHDILELDDPIIIGDTPETLNSSHTKRVLNQDDHSISFHACHSALREVEVLYDHLLALLDDNDDLNPRDIIVMVADIDNYTPYIQSVFGNAPSTRYLPYAISDRKMRQVHPIIQSFLTLLDLSHSRFTTEQVLALLAVPALAEKFEISESGLTILRKWVAESGICWGLDDDNISELDLPNTGQNTWHFGLTRMLLGYAMKSQSGLWQGILPYDESSGLIADLAGQLAEFLMQLSHWRCVLSQSKSLSDWQLLGRQLLETFFVADTETEPLLLFIEQQWLQLIHFGVESNYDEAVPITILRDDLLLRLDQSRISQRFLAGQINFCTLMPMRSIPFKVVCLLGMNDGVYPRIIPPLGFDLMVTQARRGDRSRRDDDRYLFLEALSSAQQQLYISYIGRSMQDNSQRYPSVLVTELLDYIAQSHVLIGDEDLDIDTSAQHVIQHLLIEHSRVPFSEENFKVNSETQSYASQWLPAAEGQGQAYSHFNTALNSKEIKSISLDELRRFYRHPIRAFFQQRLRVFFAVEETQLADQEPFELDNLQRYQLNQKLLNQLVEQGDADEQFIREKAAGILPYGAFGEIFWHKQASDMQQLADQVTLEKQATTSLEVNLEIAGITLSGWLHQVQNDGLLRWRPADLSIIDGLTLWLEHLVYCCLGYQGESRMYGRKESRWCFAWLEKEIAQQELANLIQGYLLGLNQPLMLLVKSAWAWLEKSYDPNTGQISNDEAILAKAKEQLIQKWQGNHFARGEGDDNYIYRLFNTLDDDHIQQIEQTACRYLLPLLKGREDFGK